MNAPVNKVQLIGHLGGNPEIKTLDKGSKMARMRLATNESYRDAKGNRIDNTQWHNLVAWEGKAEFAEKYLAKGKYLLVEGRLVHREYTDKEGLKRQSTEVRITDILLLDKKAEA